MATTESFTEESLVAATSPEVPAPAPTSGEKEANHYPEPQLRVIEARPGWKLINFREIWRHRELLFFLMWRDIMVRYKQTVLGASWAIIQPLTQMVVFSIFFGRMANFPTGNFPYPIFAFAGLLPWTFFANSLTSSANSVVSNQNLIAKVYFPRLFIPASAIGVNMADFLIASGMMLVLMGIYGTSPTVSMLAAPLIFLMLVMAAFGVGTLISALTVEYRDFRHVVPFLVQLWMFSTPTVYMDANVMGPRWQRFLPINPAYGLIQNFRYAILGHELDAYSLAISSATAILFLIVGCLYFRRVERTFADII